MFNDNVNDLSHFRKLTTRPNITFEIQKRWRTGCIKVSGTRGSRQSRGGSKGPCTGSYCAGIFWCTCYFIGDHKRKRGEGGVQRVKTKKPGKEKNYKRTGTGCLLAGEGESIHSSRAYSYISRIAACFFRVPRLCKPRTFTISYAAIHLNETRGRAKRKKLNIGPSGYAA